MMLKTATAPAASATTLVLFPMVILSGFGRPPQAYAWRLQRKVAQSRDHPYQENFAGRRFSFRLFRLLGAHGRAEPAHGFGMAVGEFACHGFGAFPPGGCR